MIRLRRRGRRKFNIAESFYIGRLRSEQTNIARNEYDSEPFSYIYQPSGFHAEEDNLEPGEVILKESYGDTANPLAPDHSMFFTVLPYNPDGRCAVLMKSAIGKDSSRTPISMRDYLEYANMGLEELSDKMKSDGVTL